MIFNTRQYLNCKPRVTDTLDVEEKQMRISFFFIHKPPWRVVGGCDGDVLNHWDSHLMK